jgi:tight adherence protein C
MGLAVGLLLVFVAIGLLITGLSPVFKEERPTLNLEGLGLETPVSIQKKEKPKSPIMTVLNSIAMVNRPLLSPAIRNRLLHDFDIAQKDITPEFFFLVKEMMIVGLLILLPKLLGAESLAMAFFLAFGLGYFLPEFWLKGEIAKVKDKIVKLLPDTVDLLGLCVNAGLDFMMALKWVIEKSSPSPIIDELSNMLQEISIGKPRRDALRDLAAKYNLSDLATFSRTLIQADKMGTSVSDALNILSEDMRLARYRRGEAMALKAPLKLLAPLLFCIFPVVGILVGGPIFLDFMLNNPLKGMAGT